jgi:hypothetical protein
VGVIFREGIAGHAPSRNPEPDVSQWQWPQRARELQGMWSQGSSSRDLQWWLDKIEANLGLVRAPDAGAAGSITALAGLQAFQQITGAAQSAQVASTATQATGVDQSVQAATIPQDASVAQSMSIANSFSMPTGIQPGANAQVLQPGIAGGPPQGQQAIFTLLTQFTTQLTTALASRLNGTPGPVQTPNGTFAQPYTFPAGVTSTNMPVSGIPPATFGQNPNVQRALPITQAIAQPAYPVPGPPANPAATDFTGNPPIPVPNPTATYPATPYVPATYPTGLPPGSITGPPLSVPPALPGQNAGMQPPGPTAQPVAQPTYAAPTPTPTGTPINSPVVVNVQLNVNGNAPTPTAAPGYPPIPNSPPTNPVTLGAPATNPVDPQTAVTTMPSVGAPLVATSTSNNPLIPGTGASITNATTPSVPATTPGVAATQQSSPSGNGSSTAVSSISTGSNPITGAQGTSTTTANSSNQTLLQANAGGGQSQQNASANNPADLKAIPATIGSNFVAGQRTPLTSTTNPSQTFSQAIGAFSATQLNAVGGGGASDPVALPVPQISYFGAISEPVGRVGSQTPSVLLQLTNSSNRITGPAQAELRLDGTIVATRPLPPMLPKQSYSVVFSTLDAGPGKHTVDIAMTSVQGTIGSATAALDVKLTPPPGDSPASGIALPRSVLGVPTTPNPTVRTVLPASPGNPPTPTAPVNGAAVTGGAPSSSTVSPTVRTLLPASPGNPAATTAPVTGAAVTGGAPSSSTVSPTVRTVLPASPGNPAATTAPVTGTAVTGGAASSSTASPTVRTVLPASPGNPPTPTAPVTGAAVTGGAPSSSIVSPTVRTVLPATPGNPPTPTAPIRPGPATVVPGSVGAAARVTPGVAPSAPRGRGPAPPPTANTPAQQQKPATPAPNCTTANKTVVPCKEPNKK